MHSIFMVFERYRLNLKNTNAYANDDSFPTRIDHHKGSSSNVNADANGRESKIESYHKNLVVFVVLSRRRKDFGLNSKPEHDREWRAVGEVVVK